MNLQHIHAHKKHKEGGGSHTINLDRMMQRQYDPIEFRLNRDAVNANTQDSILDMVKNEESPVSMRRAADGYYGDMDGMFLKADGADDGSLSGSGFFDDIGKATASMFGFDSGAPAPPPPAAKQKKFQDMYGSLAYGQQMKEGNIKRMLNAKQELQRLLALPTPSGKEVRQAHTMKTVIDICKKTAATLYNGKMYDMPSNMHYILDQPKIWEDPLNAPGLGLTLRPGLAYTQGRTHNMTDEEYKHQFGVEGQGFSNGQLHFVFDPKPGEEGYKNPWGEDRKTPPPPEPAFNDTDYDDDSPLTVPNDYLDGIPAEGAGILDDIKHIFNPASKYNNISSKTLQQYGGLPITQLAVYRTPIPSALSKVLNLLSRGSFGKEQQRAGYDKFFHLALIATVTGQKNVVLEKNEVINISSSYHTDSSTETIQVPLHGLTLTISALLEAAKKSMGDTAFFRYNAFQNNCQDFIKAVLTSNGLYTPDLDRFVYQDVKSIAKQLPTFTKKVAALTTDVAGMFSRLLGRGGGSVVDWINPEGARKFREMISKKEGVTVHDVPLTATIENDPSDSVIYIRSLNADSTPLHIYKIEADPQIIARYKKQIATMLMHYRRDAERK